MNQINFYIRFTQDPAALANGYLLIKEFLLSSQLNRQATLLNLLNPNVPILALVGNVYPCDVFPVLPEQQKNQNRAFFIELLTKTVSEEGASSKNTGNLIVFLQKIHNEEGYDQWVELYGELITKIPGSQYGKLVISLLKKADSRIAILSTKLFKYTIENGNNYGIGQETLLEIMYFCVRSFSHLEGTDNETLAIYFTPFSQEVLKFVWKNLNSSPLAMKYGLKLLTALLSDFGLIDAQANKSQLPSLPSLCLNICQYYLQEAATSNQLSIEDLDEDENQTTSFAVILYQMLELLDTIMINEEEDLELVPILASAVFGAVATKSEFAWWTRNTEQYIIAIEDEGVQSLRNRCVQMVVSLLNDHPRKEEAHRFLFDFFLTITGSTKMEQAGARNIEQLLAKHGVHSLKLSQQFVHYEEAAYFILSSCIEDLYKPEQITELLIFLANRAVTCCSPLVQIQCLLMCISKAPVSEHFYQYLIEVAKNSSSKMGTLLSVSRGLAKCASAFKIQLGSQVPVEYIAKLLDYLVHSQTKADEDVVHIILEFIIKLSDCSEENKKILAGVLGSEIQLFMLHNYLHDGMLATMVLQLLDRLPHEETISAVTSSVMMGATAEERYGQLMVKWLKSNHLRLDRNHMIVLLQKYRSNRPIINGIVKFSLAEACRKGTEIQLDQELVTLLNQSPDQSWLIYMLQCKIMNNPKLLLVECAKTVAYEITSQYQLECKLTLPFYMGIYFPSQFIQALQEIESLYSDFMDKIHRYAQLFQGDHLKVITSLFWLKLSSTDFSLAGKAVELIEGYGQIKVDEWQDEVEEDVEEEDLMERLLGAKMVNEEIEAEFQNIFRELSWSSELVREQLAELKSKI